MSSTWSVYHNILCIFGNWFLSVKCWVNVFPVRFFYTCRVLALLLSTVCSHSASGWPTAPFQWQLMLIGPESLLSVCSLTHNFVCQMPEGDDRKKWKRFIYTLGSYVHDWFHHCSRLATFFKLSSNFHEWWVIKKFVNYSNHNHRIIDRKYLLNCLFLLTFNCFAFHLWFFWCIIVSFPY